MYSLPDANTEVEIAQSLAMHKNISSPAPTHNKNQNYPLFISAGISDLLFPLLYVQCHLFDIHEGLVLPSENNHKKRPRG